MALGDTEQFSLRWNNFHSNLSSGFQSLLAEEDLVDVTLAVGGRVIQAHKIILSVCSPYFKQLFKLNPCKHPIVILKDVQHKDLVDILQFMYQGEVNVRQEDLGSFLKTAELLQIKGLTEQDAPQEGGSEPDPPPQSPVQDRGVPRIRQIRRRIDKPPIPRLEKQPSPRAQSPLVPYKRMRPDTSSRSPVVLNEDASGLECIDLKSPKMEPVDYVSDVEPQPLQSSEPVTKEDLADSSLAGETSRQSLHDSVQGPSSEHELTQDSSAFGLLQQHSTASLDKKPGNVTPSGSDTNNTQDGESGGLHYVESRSGKLQLVHDGYIYHLNMHQGATKYWRCVEYVTMGCRGRCITANDQLIGRPRFHTHERQYEKILQKEKCAIMRKEFGRRNQVDMTMLTVGHLLP